MTTDAEKLARAVQALRAIVAAHPKCNACDRPARYTHLVSEDDFCSEHAPSRALDPIVGYGAVVLAEEALAEIEDS